MKLHALAAWTLALGLTPALIAPSPAMAQDPTAVPGADIEGVELYPVESANHSRDPIDYELLPPAGGEHHPIWQDCGFYDRPIIAEHAVHSQEHGAVWITFQPDLPEDQVAMLEDMIEAAPYLIVSPFPGQDAPVILSAWGAQLKVDDVSDERVEAFLRAFIGGGPEPGAACFSGTNETVDFPIGTPVASPVATPASA